MKIMFNGLGPKDTINYNGKLYRNGSVVELEEGFAKPYIESKLALEVNSEQDLQESEALQKLETKNAARRREIEKKAEQKKDGDSQ